MVAGLPGCVRPESWPAATRPAGPGIGRRVAERPGDLDLAVAPAQRDDRAVVTGPGDHGPTAEIAPVDPPWGRRPGTRRVNPSHSCWEIGLLALSSQSVARVMGSSEPPPPPDGRRSAKDEPHHTAHPGGRPQPGRCGWGSGAHRPRRGRRLAGPGRVRPVRRARPAGAAGHPQPPAAGPGPGHGHHPGPHPLLPLG